MTKQSLISILILIFLSCLGVLVWREQFDYDERLFRPRVVQSDAGEQKNQSPEIVFELPATVSPMSDPETFDLQTLSDKIDGKADIYLESGFVRLFARRFVHRSTESAEPAEPGWFECFIYDMQTPRNAFAVFSVQRREDVTPADVAPHAYLTENGLFFVHGPHYVEMIGSREDKALLAAMTETAKSLVRQVPGGPLDLPEARLFPRANFKQKSLRLIPKNAFGYDRFDNVATGVYQLDGPPITAFVSLRKSAEEARTLASGYALFLADLMDIDPARDKGVEIPGLQVVDLLGEYEMVFACNHVLAGIHGAPDKAAAQRVARELYDHLKNNNRQLP